MRKLWLVVCVFGCQQDVLHQPPPPPIVVVVPPPKPVPTPPITPVRRLATLPVVRHHVTRATQWFLALTEAKQSKVKQLCRFRAENPCAGLLKSFGDDNPDPSIQLLASLSDWERKGVNGFCAETNVHARGCNTPLVLALDDQPVELTPADSHRFAFRAGAPVATDWPTAATPWLALDRDGDGAITGGAELFGDATALPDGTMAHDGFAALAALDANGDGVIDARDPAFASLLLWTDINGDRRSTPDELQPAASVVTSIPLAHTRDPRCNARGDCEGERGVVRWRDGRGGDRTGAVVDVYVPAR